jgi:hypothetical protein
MSGSNPGEDTNYLQRKIFVLSPEIGRACGTNRGKRNAYRILVGKSDGKIPLGRPKHRWVNNIKMDLR